MDDQPGRTEYVDVAGGRIAYEVVGEGPLVVLSPGMADTRSTYRFLAPLLADAGYRVASVDLRGHGESSVPWDSYTHADTADDLIAVIRTLGGPAVIVGQSFSGGAVTIAAATNPDLVSAIVEIDPFTRPPGFSAGAMLRNDHNYRRGALLLGRFVFRGSVKTWSSTSTWHTQGASRPTGTRTWLRSWRTCVNQAATEAAQKMVGAKATLKEASARLADVRCPALVVMGSDDSDFPDPKAEAAAIVGLLPAGLGRYEMIENAGHYPHAQYPQEVTDVVLPFLAERDHA